MKHKVILPVYQLSRKKWTLTDEPPKNGDYGHVLWKEKQIDIRTKRVTTEEKVDTAIHETIHTVMPWLTEDAVLNLTLSIMKVLRAYDAFDHED